MAGLGKARRLSSAVGLTIACALLLMLLPGCWNSKDIQNLAYITAIGIDYKDNRYITYVQVLNFSNIARSENSQLGKKVPIWIGRGEGRTVVESFDAILATSQLRVFWGHVKTVVVTENLMRKGVVDVYNAMNRYREIRYNVNMYGTKERLDEIFTQKSMFNLSPLDTLMYTPEHAYDQRSFIDPVYGHQVIARINEPGQPTMIPSISITRKVWDEDTKSVPMLILSGAYFFNSKVLAGWLSADDLKGARWTQQGLEKAYIQVPAQAATPTATFAMQKPKYTIRSIINGNEVRYDIKVRVKGKLAEIMQEASVDELEKMAQDKIKQEIKDTFRSGLAANCDVFQLEESLYRNHPKVWHQLYDKKSRMLTEDSLRRIDVKVTITSMGKYKGRAGY